jgi:hypothetical protein
MLAAFKIMITGSIHGFLYGTGLPSYAALLAWRYAALFPLTLHSMVPLCAFIYFAWHVGFTMHLWYAAYWVLIPALYLLVPTLRNHVVVRALTASMTAHIVGALLMVTCGSFTTWSSLIAVVPFERMIAVLGMLATVAGMRMVRRFARVFA